ncbi:hypothetical protein HEP84_53620 [Streptomyces sp. RLB1-33]|nr:hypothetical protein [Streptomyces sp. RLB1-33]QIY76379.1 hypothetical protein HEP84_53620 [Streptomyces sp. RLB1-33]
MPDPQPPLVSVVVSARGNTQHVRNLLDALAQQTLPAGLLEARLGGRGGGRVSWVTTNIESEMAA